MGIPAPNEDGQDVHHSSAAVGPPSSYPNGQQVASELPPAALELAAKLFDYARQGATDSLAQYLNAGIPPNLTDHKGDTLLMLAAYHGHTGTTRMLLELGADPNVLNGRGQSIIAGAVFKGFDEIVKLLFEGVQDKKADIRLGHPNAVDSASMFKRDNYLELFGVQGAGPRPWEDRGAST